MWIRFMQKGWYNDVKYQMAFCECGFTYMPENWMLYPGALSLLDYKFIERQWNVLSIILSPVWPGAIPSYRRSSKWELNE